MKKYRVIVDGQEYEVGIEPLDASELKPMHQETAPVKKPEQADPALGGENVLSPMPGNILSIRIQNGVSVKKGQVLMILEAMKMENEIIAPRDGTIVSVKVASGAAVDTGAVLCVLK